MSDHGNGNSNGSDDLEEDERRHRAVWDLYRTIAERIGIEAKITQAEWGRRFAAILIALGADDEASEEQAEVVSLAQLVAIEQFGAHYIGGIYTKKRGRFHSKAEAAAREAERIRRKREAEVEAAGRDAEAADDGTFVHPNGHAEEAAAVDAAVQAQLEFPITVAGRPPTKTGDATHYVFYEAEYASARRLRSEARNWRHNRHFRLLTKPWPERSPNSLLRAGLIAADQLRVPQTPTGLPEGFSDNGQDVGEEDPE